MHGEYKTPGGKLVMVDFRHVEGRLRDVTVAGDFFLYPDDALGAITASLEGAEASLDERALAERVARAIAPGTELLGTSPEGIAIAVRRALATREQEGVMSTQPPASREHPSIEELTGQSDAEREARWSRYDWQLLPSTPLDPVIQIALDETLTLAVGRGDRDPTLRFWGWKASCVVLGRFQSVRNEVNEDVAWEEEVELVRRISGGGAMFIEPEGAITYSIYAPEEMVAGMTFPQSYAFFDAWVIDALRELGVDAWYVPLNDITSSGGKIGGAAQARRGGGVLHHTTMAYQMNIPRMLRVLRIGQEKLSDKGVTSAEKRVGPLRQQTDLDRDVIIHHLIGHFRARFGLQDDEIRDEEMANAKLQAEQRFGTPEWLHFLP